MMSDRKHSYLKPSGAHVWSKCAAWPKMNERFPQEYDSAAGAEGTAAHWAAWQLLMDPNARYAVAPNGTVITEEMIEAGELLCDTIRSRSELIATHHIEERIPIPLISSTCSGTPDWWGVTVEHDHIEIVDYKFGFRFVDEFWNPQGLCYLAGILDILCQRWDVVYSELLDRLTVSFTIVQPRCYYRGSSVRTHSFKAREALPYFEHLTKMATLSFAHVPIATTNEHCGYCPGRHACSALQLAGYTAAEYSEARVPVELEAAAAGLELRILERALAQLNARVEGLRELTINNIRAGKLVPYFRVEQGIGRLTWTIPEDQVTAMGGMFGKDLSKPGVVTPTQAKKLGMDEVIIRAYSIAPQTSLRLVAENPSDAARVFGNPSVKEGTN